MFSISLNEIWTIGERTDCNQSKNSVALGRSTFHLRGCLEKSPSFHNTYDLLVINSRRSRLIWTQGPNQLKFIIYGNQIHDDYILATLQRSNLQCLLQKYVEWNRHCSRIKKWATVSIWENSWFNLSQSDLHDLWQNKICLFSKLGHSKTLNFLWNT